MKGGWAVRPPQFDTWDRSVALFMVVHGRYRYTSLTRKCFIIVGLRRLIP